MQQRRISLLLGVLLVGATLCTGPRAAWAIAGTDQLAKPGEEYSQQLADQWGWPRGTLRLVNDHLRTYGWHHWFSELPNDSVIFEYDVKNTAEVNRLIQRLQKIQSSRRLVQLATGEPPRERNDEPPGAVRFTIGSQKRLDQWWQHLPEDKQFGVHKFPKRPTAAPPTLWIYVEHSAIDLNAIAVPIEVDVEAYAPKTANDEPPTKSEQAVKQFVEEHKFRQKKVQ